MPKLQLALDQLSWNPAEKVVNEIGEYVDIIEFGTPLVKGIGISFITEMIKRMRKDKRLKNKEFLIDTKTMDVPAYEAKLCFDMAKADYMTVLGVAPLKVLTESIQDVKDRKEKHKVFFDLMNIAEHTRQCNRAVDIVKLHIKKEITPHLGVHSGISEQTVGSAVPGLNKLIKILNKKNVRNLCQVAVAGGVKLDKYLPKILDLNPDVIIVGGALTGKMSKSERIGAVKEFQRKLSNI